MSPERLKQAEDMMAALNGEVGACWAGLGRRPVGEVVIKLLRIRKGLDALVSFLSFMPADETAEAVKIWQESGDAPPEMR